MDAERIMPHLEGKEVFTEEEEKTIMDEKDTEKRTEAFLDIIELKTATAYDLFIEALGEVYPHVFLMLTDQQDKDGESLYE